ncbi:MAG: response regulator [Verrucomicrobiota bacterium]
MSRIADTRNWKAPPNQVLPRNQPIDTQNQLSDVTLPEHSQQARELHIALVNDNESVYSTVKEMAKSENWKVEYYPDGLRAVQNIMRTHPDIVLIDNEISGLSGIDCARKLKCLVPLLPVIILADNSDFENVFTSLTAGVTGYLLKPLSLDQFRNMVSTVIEGGVVLCKEAQTALLSCLCQAFASTSTASFSERERQVLTCLMQNMCDKDIGKRLKIETNTVHVHLVRLFQRLGVHNRREAVRKFFQRCLATACDECNNSLFKNNLRRSG